jgi:hypothetical protein
MPLSRFCEREGPIAKQWEVRATRSVVASGWQRLRSNRESPPREGAHQAKRICLIHPLTLRALRARRPLPQAGEGRKCSVDVTRAN